MLRESCLIWAQLHHPPNLRNKRPATKGASIVTFLGHLFSDTYIFRDQCFRHRNLIPDYCFGRKMRKRVRRLKLIVEFGRSKSWHLWWPNCEKNRCLESPRVLLVRDFRPWRFTRAYAGHERKLSFLMSSLRCELLCRISCLQFARSNLPRIEPTWERKRAPGGREHMYGQCWAN